MYRDTDESYESYGICMHYTDE